MTAKQKQGIKLVSNLLTARRNGNVKREQTEYEKLLTFCENNNFDFDNVLIGGTKWLKQNSIGATMNAIV